MSTDLTTLGVETQFVTTPFLVEGLRTIQAVVDSNRIAAIDGPAGSGKTTTVRLFREQSTRPCALATMPGRPAPLDLLRLVHQALHGVAPPRRLNRFELQNGLLAHLTDWRGVLIVDELQNSAIASMQDLVWLYEESDHAFAVVVVGTNVIDAVRTYPQLLTRMMGSVTFAPLYGEQLIAAVRGLDPRLDATPTGVLLTHNANACGGILRRWVMTILWLNQLGHPDGAPVTPAASRTSRKGSRDEPHAHPRRLCGLRPPQRPKRRPHHRCRRIHGKARAGIRSRLRHDSGPARRVRCTRRRVGRRAQSLGKPTSHPSPSADLRNESCGGPARRLAPSAQEHRHPRRVVDLVPRRGHRARPHLRRHRRRGAR